MKGEFTLLLVLAVIPGCSREDPRHRMVQTADSTQLVSRSIEAEPVIWDYYLSIENEVRKDLGVAQTDIAERVQFLIDDGYVKRPVLLAITKEGPRWVTVDYHTYREYMTSNAIISRRFYGIQQNILDSLMMDSIRSSLLNALNGEPTTGCFASGKPD